MATLNGLDVFGLAVHAQHLPDDPVIQENHYFGVSGIQSLYGGQPGRRFRVTGLLPGSSPAGCKASEAALLALGNGVAYTFVDSWGVAWPNVLLEHYVPDAEGPKSTDWGWVLPYECELRGLQ